jgi:hypothetical protein
MVDTLKRSCGYNVEKAAFRCGMRLVLAMPLINHFVGARSRVLYSVFIMF